MSGAALARFIGKEGLARLVASTNGKGSVLVPVKVKDARSVFGRVDVLVSPIGGEGELWMDAERLTLSEGADA